MFSYSYLATTCSHITHSPTYLLTYYNLPSYLHIYQLPQTYLLQTNQPTYLCTYYLSLTLKPTYHNQPTYTLPTYLYTYIPITNPKLSCDLPTYLLITSPPTYL